ncbi:hypothetical protein FIBSPDRAFT_858479 [Athelia psychrophila]|uniref:Ubiquinol-cytochrome c chaperone domain-containing protein n=1 Tax=Athelia psychrophila TaxID=1759441 RepID=A0A166M0Z4_9AGAM|nr:hypothetical protein FIBSPDRAFT_858479 [Fibularhizoctonia sp. CBS 109695]
MTSRAILSRSVRSAQHYQIARSAVPRSRHLATSNASPSRDAPESSTSAKAELSPATPEEPKSWLTRKIDASPRFKAGFIVLANAMGYGSAMQVAARRSFNIYNHLCVPRADQEDVFWLDECHLPPTFQSWFTITNLHVWLLTVRFRALPKPEADYFIQGLIDHFFLDVEDRIRAVLQPGVQGERYTLQTAYYSIPKAIALRTDNGKLKGNSPERLVTKQMRIFREQYNGLGLSLDLGLVKGDVEMAGAVWRNFLGARGAQGILLPSDGGAAAYRRNINPTGEVEGFGNMTPEQLEAEAGKDDGSGVHDFAPHESDQYVRYPETMLALNAYIRRELLRLENISDEELMGQMKIGTEWMGVQDLKFGSVKAADGL